MNVLGLYAVYDSVVGIYYTPFVARSKGEAVRMFNSSMEKQPVLQKDCKLYCLGYFSEEDGVITVTQTGKPEFICNYEVVDNVG